MIVEYAKSGRSSCKICAKAISASALWLGLVTRDERGFDMTKRHHLHCLPINSADSIEGFSSLKSSDQEELKKLMKESTQALDKLLRRDDDDESNELEEKKVKKKKLSITDKGGELEIALSASEIKEKYKDYPRKGEKLT